MTGTELNRLRLKAEVILDKANELIRFINMNENVANVVRKHSSLIGDYHTSKMNHSINRRNVIIESLKNDLECIR